MIIISKKEYENLLSRVNRLEEDKANSDKMIFDIECRLRQYIDDYFEHKCKTVVKIVDAYAEELKNWNFFSDLQRAYVTEDRRIVVCLRDYQWYATKEPIINELDCIKALFEIDWAASFAEDNRDSYMKYWDKR